ncbi:OFA family MFS transporter [Mucilaginibacter sp.]|uniref:L-lactate MFS transporter n=1 Tax=Mucilaginibacter sp. TaxID=1882438 RepID=UPI00261828CA|nr:OFA family MFS transporter [Mucilaginibacter sp.]MDB4919586.1 major facilitator superfamily 1 [Mucilaginibacter sp.]
MKKSKRWWIAVAGVLLQMALGAVYAWSVFRIPLAKQFHWSISQVTLAFTIAIMSLGFASFFGGLWLKKVGPRVVALTGGLLYGGGVFLASYSYHGLWWLYMTYGLIGGTGLGLSYIVPISVLVKWFPDHRGLMTGVAVGGFGAGALITAPIATRLIQSVGVLQTFEFLGIAYLLVSVLSGYFMQNPPEDWQPQGLKNNKKQLVKEHAGDFTLGRALKTWQWWSLWLLLFLNTSAGITIISQEAPMFQELVKATAIVAAGMIGIVSIGNALGRVFWAWTSDLLGRRATFTIMFIVQIGLFWILPGLHSVTSVTIFAFLILMCYGGGFGTMPAFVADYFGSTNLGSIYGLILTAWGFASAFGPLLIAHMRQSSGAYTSGLHIIAIVMAVSIILPLVVRPPVRHKT